MQFDIPQTTLVPHVTVLFDAGRPLCGTLENPVHWRIGEFVLIESRAQSTAIYRVLARWPLQS